MASVPTPRNSLLGLLDASRNATEAEQKEDAVLTDPRCLRSSKEFLILCENRSTLRNVSNADCRSPEAESAGGLPRRISAGLCSGVLAD